MLTLVSQPSPTDNSVTVGHVRSLTQARGSPQGFEGSSLLVAVRKPVRVKKLSVFLSQTSFRFLSMSLSFRYLRATFSPKGNKEQTR